MAVTAPTPATGGESARPRRRRFAKTREFLEILWDSKIAVFGLSLVMFWILVAFFADNCIVNPIDCLFSDNWEPTPWIARYSPTEFHRNDTSYQYFDLRSSSWVDTEANGRPSQRQGPSSAHILGTDAKSRDLWARLAYGSRPVLTLAPLSIVVALFFGGAFGVVSGYYGGYVDEIIMRTTDALMAFPQILLYLVIIAALGPSALNIVIAITLAGMPGIARLVRGLTLDIKTRDYVAAAQTRGEHPVYIMLVEILPNASGPIIIDAMLRTGYAVFAIGTLGFLGLGLPPPSPDWGSMVSSGKAFIQSGHPWDALWASLAIASLVVGLNLLADGMNEQLNRYR